MLRSLGCARPENTLTKNGRDGRDGREKWRVVPRFGGDEPIPAIKWRAQKMTAMIHIDKRWRAGRKGQLGGPSDTKATCWIFLWTSKFEICSRFFAGCCCTWTKSFSSRLMIPSLQGMTLWSKRTVYPRAYICFHDICLKYIIMYPLSRKPNWYCSNTHSFPQIGLATCDPTLHGTELRREMTRAKKSNSGNTAILRFSAGFQAFCYLRKAGIDMLKQTTDRLNEGFRSRLNLGWAGVWN